MSRDGGWDEGHTKVDVDVQSLAVLDGLYKCREGWQILPRRVCASRRGRGHGGFVLLPL